MIFAIYIGFYVAVTTVHVGEFQRRGCRLLAWDFPLFLLYMLTGWPLALVVKIDHACRKQ